MQYIIMQDKHPIDELFRQGLERASVAPPSNVWTTIQRERGRDRNDWWWIGGAGAILIGFGLAVWPGQEPSTTRDPETSAQTVRPFAQEAAPSAWSPAHLASVDVPMDTEKPRHVEDDRGEDLAETGSEGAHPNAEMPVVVGTRTRLSLAGTGTHGVLECGGTSRPFNQEIDGAELSKFVLEELALLPPALEHVEGAPGAATPSGYLLDPGEFWIAAELGVFRLDGRHASKDAALDAARDRSLSPGMEVGGGLMIGRTWQSGFQVGIGLARHVGEQDFVHGSRAETLTWDLQESVTLLDTIVIAQSVDSVATILAHDTRTRGALRTTLWVVPIEGGWGLRRGRWSLELLVGLAWERHRWTSGPSLTRSTEGGGTTVLLANEASGKELRSDVLGIRAGAMLGFWPHERLRLSVGPWYDQGLTLLSGEGALHRRTGGRLRVSYLLERPGK